MEVGPVFSVGFISSVPTELPTIGGPVEQKRRSGAFVINTIIPQIYATIQATHGQTQ